MMRPIYFKNDDFIVIEMNIFFVDFMYIYIKLKQIIF
jgi:hypothetical protein